MSQPKYKEKHAKDMQKLHLKSIDKQKKYVQKKIQQTTTKYKSNPRSRYREITLKQNHGKDLRDSMKNISNKNKVGLHFLFAVAANKQTLRIM